MRTSYRLAASFPVLAIAALSLTVCGGTAVAQNEDWQGYPRQEWPLAGGHFGQTRHSTLSQITPQNVGELGGAWVTDLDGGEASRSALVMRNGLVFLQTGSSIRALDAATGAERWRRMAPVGRMNKGVALGAGLVFAGLNDSRLIALDQETGELAWEHLVGVEGQVGQWISSPATYADGLVIVGMANGDSYLRGRIVAIDASTGERRWLFEVIPEPGTRGADSWPVDSDVWRFGGGGVWMTPTVDVDLGILFVGTGNAVPMWGGELRPGDNLFTSSVVALDLRSGQYRWHRQLVHHDMWEHDMATPLIVYEGSVGGVTTRALAAMRTDGYLFMLDAETGEPLFPIEERPVPQDDFLRTAPTQPFPVGADKIGARCVDPDMIPTGFDAGCYYDPIGPDMPNLFIPYMTMRFAPMSYSPVTGYFYGMACVYPRWIKRPDNAWFFTGTAVRAPGLRQHGLHVALDSRTNKIVWQHEVPYSDCNSSGAMTTASGLMFHTEPDGNLGAYDQRTGERLWQFQTGQIGIFGSNGHGGGPVATYELDGDQYVALTMNRAVWAFKLGGSVPPRATPEPPFTILPFEGPVVNTDSIELKRVLIQNNQNMGRVDEWHDNYGLTPTRAAVDRGARITWTNPTDLSHTIQARDGSWSTGPIAPGASGTVTIDAAGDQEYICTEHPWTIGQLVVE
jgi:alcohol dehydrogenase (cytochrome c)